MEAVLAGLAPIGISTYSRIGHLKKTIDALKKNTLALNSELYIFSDAPKKGDEEIVNKVRRYIKTIDGFKHVHIVERITNGRVANNRGGIKQLLSDYGKIIYLEDDIVTAPGFLQFMNDALDFYKDSSAVLSVTGYCPPINMPNNFRDDFFVLQRFNGWGFATWAEKFDPFGFDLNEFDIEEFLVDKKRIKAFKSNGDDLYPMLLSEYNNDIDALDVRIMYYEYEKKMVTLYPLKSLVQNIGHDNSGIHCGSDDKFDHDELWKKTTDFKFNNDVSVDERVRKENFKFRRFGIKDRVISYTKEIGVYPMLKKIKNSL